MRSCSFVWIGGRRSVNTKTECISRRFGKLPSEVRARNSSYYLQVHQIAFNCWQSLANECQHLSRTVSKTRDSAAESFSVLLTVLTIFQLPPAAVLINVKLWKRGQRANRDLVAADTCIDCLTKLCTIASLISVPRAHRKGRKIGSGRGSPFVGPAQQVEPGSPCLA